METQLKGCCMEVQGSGSSDSLVPGLRCILYFPFMHSEELSVQEVCSRRSRTVLVTQVGFEGQLR